MLDPEDLVSRQLAATGPTRVRFDDGSTTTLVPARFVPRRAEPEARLSLDGTWRAIRWPFPADEEELLSPRCDPRGWERVEQPGKVFYADPEEDPATIPNYDPAGLTHLDPSDGAILRRRADLPAAWAGQRIFLRFDAVYPAARFYLDGSLLGEHRAGLVPIEFDVTDRVRPGRIATVAVRLFRRHPLVEMDMPRQALEFAGLAQSACFHAAGPCLISDYHLVASLDAHRDRGTIAGEVAVTNASGEARQGAVVVQATNPRTGRDWSAGESVHLAPGEARTVQVRLELDDAEPWSDETPNLYDVWVQLQAERQAAQNVRYRTGLRRLDLEGRPRWNGRPVKFRGVHFRSFHPESGLHLPKEWLGRSLQMMKHANINAIWTHYSAPPALADLCDELGLYLIQEITADPSSHLPASAACLGPVLQRVEATVRRDRHHVSVCGFSLGGGDRPADAAPDDRFRGHLRAMEALARRLAPDKAMMPAPPGDAGFRRQEAVNDRTGEAWAAARDDPACLGIAIGTWMAAGAGRPWGWTRPADDIGRGLVTGDLLPKPSFWALRALYSPVLFPERVAWRPGQTELVLTVRNLYTATDLAQCTLRTMLGRPPRRKAGLATESGPGPGAGVVRSWRDVPMAGPPGQTAPLRIPIWDPETLEALGRGCPAVCRCVVLDPSGYCPVTADVLIVPDVQGAASPPPEH